MSAPSQGPIAGRTRSGKMLFASSDASLASKLAERAGAFIYGESADPRSTASRDTYRRVLDSSVPFFPIGSDTDRSAQSSGPTEWIPFLRWFADQLRSASQSGRPVILDYTCLPPSFCVAALLAQDAIGGGEVVFTYTLAENYRHLNEPRTVHRIRSLPGVGGRIQASSQSALLLSLGFDGPLSSAVEEYLQPRDLFVALAEPVYSEMNGLVERANEPLFEQASGRLRVSVSDVLGLAASARDLVDIAGDSTGLHVAPLGPKTHALALALAAVLDKNITYLDVVADGAVHAAVSAVKTTTVVLSTHFSRPSFSK